MVLSPCGLSLKSDKVLQWVLVRTDGLYLLQGACLLFVSRFDFFQMKYSLGIYDMSDVMKADILSQRLKITQPRRLSTEFGFSRSTFPNNIGFSQMNEFQKRWSALSSSLFWEVSPTDSSQLGLTIKQCFMWSPALRLQPLKICCLNFLPEQFHSAAASRWFWSAGRLKAPRHLMSRETTPPASCVSVKVTLFDASGTLCSTDTRTPSGVDTGFLPGSSDEVSSACVRLCPLPGRPSVLLSLTFAELQIFMMFRATRNTVVPHFQHPLSLLNHE